MIWMAACRRDTSGSLSVMSQSSRPIVVPGSSGRSVPCAGSCSMKTKSLIAVPLGDSVGARLTPDGAGSGRSGCARTPETSVSSLPGPRRASAADASTGSATCSGGSDHSTRRNSPADSM